MYVGASSAGFGYHGGLRPCDVERWTRRWCVRGQILSLLCCVRAPRRTFVFLFRKRSAVPSIIKRNCSSCERVIPCVFAGLEVKAAYTGSDGVFFELCVMVRVPCVIVVTK